MVKPYLIFDRQGNGVDINNMFDKTKSCYGCPDIVAEPRCHMTCKEYKDRQADDAEKRESKRLENISFIPDSVYVSRSDIVGRMERKGYRR